MPVYKGYNNMNQSGLKNIYVGEADELQIA